MRTNEERVACVKRRVAELERQKRLRQKCMVATAALCASLLLIAGLAIVLPRLEMRLGGAAGAEYEMAASIFSSSATAGYVLIGLLAFVLGVSVTVLCYRLKAFHDENGEDSHDRTL